MRFSDSVNKTAQCYQLSNVVLSFILTQQAETTTIYHTNFQVFPRVVAQMMVIFCIRHYVVCTDISNKHTATIFRVCDMCHVNAEVTSQKKMCQSHINSQLSLFQENPSFSSHPP